MVGTLTDFDDDTTFEMSLIRECDFPADVNATTANVTALTTTTTTPPARSLKEPTTTTC
jgi:hypothetical protein